MWFSHLLAVERNCGQVVKSSETQFPHLQMVATTYLLGLLCGVDEWT
jgi:hypothetical protein